jgi:hypothetical protein
MPASDDGTIISSVTTFGACANAAPDAATAAAAIMIAMNFMEVLLGCRL